MLISCYLIGITFGDQDLHQRLQSGIDISDCCHEIRKITDIVCGIHEYQDIDEKREKRVEQCTKCLCGIGCAIMCKPCINPIQPSVGLAHVCPSCIKHLCLCPITGQCLDCCTYYAIGRVCGPPFLMVFHKYLKCANCVMNEGFVDQCGRRNEARPLAEQNQQIQQGFRV